MEDRVDRTNRFVLRAPFEARGDQPQAIAALAEGIEQGKRAQTLLGVTGSGKTYTMASVIERVQRPALVIAHNKTLAAQLCSEFKSFFPDNAVEYFVSYYDYYQPEAYIASSDTYIEKDSSINEEIDRLRHSATASLRERRDVIIVSSVSCIYAMGDPSEYERLSVSLRPRMALSRDALLRQLVEIQFFRNDIAFERGTFRVRGDTVEVIPASEREKALRIEFFGDEIDRLSEIDLVTGRALRTLQHAMIFPNSHYANSRESVDAALNQIELDLAERVTALRGDDRLIEAQRLEQRTHYDLEMLREIGYCNGIENYSRYFDGRSPGDPPFTLMDYFPKDFIVLIDESHVTVPQVRAMFNGDRARKQSLVEYGFRLPSAFDNRPLRFAEFEERVRQAVYVSATPAAYELNLSGKPVEQIIRPTGLIDPCVILRPARGQVDDLLGEVRQVTERGYRTLVTTLTKRMAESLTVYFEEMRVRVRYLHSDIETLERTKILRDLRLGEFDVLVGINLLREGLDLPEVALVAILDADKEGFLRSETSLIQTIGRAARNADGRVILYADAITDSMRRAMEETDRRRAIQEAYNQKHGITPESIQRTVHALLEITSQAEENAPADLDPEEKAMLAAKLEDQMLLAAAELDFEKAAKFRDELLRLRGSSPVEKPQGNVKKHDRRRGGPRAGKRKP
ncbi:MAG: excinuclease ABC subunit UvrB [Oscillospiraceae bacterium]|jgi:excinuclease ABC subunit B|nr:excinuclease ABC subunit UvrB [Oscillospiraceae bacterium]